jgi:hypothetical protein
MVHYFPIPKTHPMTLDPYQMPRTLINSVASETPLARRVTIFRAPSGNSITDLYGQVVERR